MTDWSKNRYDDHISPKSTVPKDAPANVTPVRKRGGARRFADPWARCLSHYLRRVRKDLTDPDPEVREGARRWFFSSGKGPWTLRWVVKRIRVRVHAAAGFYPAMPNVQSERRRAREIISESDKWNQS